MIQITFARRSAFLAALFLLLVWGIRLSTAMKAGETLPSIQPDSPAAERGKVFYFPLVMNPYPRFSSSHIPLYGVNFISAAEDVVDQQRYQNGLSTGATWNRWPIYWYRVEKSEGAFDWSAHDALVQADIDHGLRIDAILMGTPGFYVSGVAELTELDRPLVYKTFAMSAPNASIPLGLHAPVFSDGSDIPGPGKTINPDNKWARFVSEAVNRYRPAGVLAAANGWPAGVGITHWEMWNEQDYSFFWNSSVPDYARLLKVGYLAAKTADPNARVMFGGLANFEQPNFLNDVLNLFDTDQMASSQGYFFDILATHSYFDSWESWYHVWRAKRTMRAHGFDKPVWLNESGVPVWNDYPGPVWDSKSPWRATLDEQASYVIQSAFYATWAGAEALFNFQLHDGCGNQPFGTNFPPHNGELCNASGMLISDPRFPCAGDAFGFFSNPSDPAEAACFWQHPNPESARPSLPAFRILTTYLREVIPLWRTRPGGSDPYNGPQEWIAFYRPASAEKIVGLWARFGTAQTALVPAESSSAILIDAGGNAVTIYPSGGYYSIQLPAATNQNDPFDPSAFPIGGRPYILIEKLAG